MLTPNLMQSLLDINFKKKAEKLECFYSRGGSQVSDELGVHVAWAKVKGLGHHHICEGKDSHSFDCSEQIAHTEGQILALPI